MFDEMPETLISVKIMTILDLLYNQTCYNPEGPYTQDELYITDR